MGIDDDPRTLDPRFVVDAEGELVVGAVFEPLVRLDDRARVVPGAAESYDVLDDGAAFHFTLRDAAFHDGTPVTAADFKQTFDRIANVEAEPRSPLGVLIAPIVGSQEADDAGIRGVIVEGPRTLRIELDTPDPEYLETLAHPALVPVPAVADDDPVGFAQQPIGNGPFAVAEPHVSGSFIRLRAVDDHWRAPEVDEILLSVYGDDRGHQQQLRDLENGQLHIGRIDAADRSAAEDAFGTDNDGYRGTGVLSGVRGTVYMFGFATDQAPFDDPRVRRALSMSIDREGMAEVLLGGTRTAADAIVPPSIAGSQPGVCGHCRLDQIEARLLWDEAAVEVDSITIAHNRGATHAAIAESVAADIERALDVSVELQAYDLPDFFGRIRAGDVTFFRLGWEPTEPTLAGYLWPLFHSDSPENVTGYANSDVDDQLEEARHAPSLGSRLARYRLAEQAILDDAPAIPLLWYPLDVVVRPGVEGVAWTALDRVDLALIRLDASVR